MIKLTRNPVKHHHLHISHAGCTFEVPEMFGDKLQRNETH